MYVIGMTGGVGSGKTQAACLLKEIASAELLIADELGHVAMEKGTDGYEEIIESFGTDILDADGQISRTVMAEHQWLEIHILTKKYFMIKKGLLCLMGSFIRK